MTTTVYRPSMNQAGITPYTLERRIAGTPAYVADTVARVRRSGRLVAMTTPRLTPTGDGSVYVNVRYLAPPPTQARPKWPVTRRRTGRRTAVRITAVAVPVAGAAVVAGYGLLRLVAELVHLLPILAGTAGFLLLAWIVLGRAGICPGVHCPGCAHGGH